MRDVELSLDTDDLCLLRKTSTLGENRVRKNKYGFERHEDTVNGLRNGYSHIQHFTRKQASSDHTQTPRNVVAEFCKNDRHMQKCISYSIPKELEKLQPCKH